MAMEVPMQNITSVATDTVAIGASDHRLSRFENIFPIPNGVSYNSYVILDEKTVLIDTADLSIADQFLENLQEALGGKKLDFLVVQHVEPDHSSMIAEIVREYPDVVLYCSKQAWMMINQFFPEIPVKDHVEIKEGDTLGTGTHTLHFVAAPMVHWPEVMVTYDDLTGVLFSADAFGTFGAVEGSVFADDHDFEREYLDDARRYYANIVGKYGPQAGALLKKAAGLDIKTICPLHGPVWRKDLGWFIGKYQLWSSYTPESSDYLVVYSTLYGHTASAAQACAAKIAEKTGRKAAVYDASETDCSYLISEVWRCGRIVLFCPTYNMGIYPKMETFLNDMIALNVQNRTFAVAENGTWAPAAGKLTRAKLACLKNCTILEEGLTIRSALTEKDEGKLDAFVDAIVKE